MPELVRNIEDHRRPVCREDVLEDREEQHLNNALLTADDPADESADTAPPKRNTKDSLIDKIMSVSEKYNLEVKYSDTKLKRMNKKQLTRILAEIIEESVKIDMCKQVGVEPGANNRTLGLAALRMMHDIAATGFEKGAQTFLPEYGYTMDGFTEALKEPVCSQAIDQCLTEIAAESPEILQYFESPYARLALSWSSALLSCVRKKRGSIKEHATHLGPRYAERRPPVRDWVRRSPENREEHGDKPPVVPNVQRV